MDILESSYEDKSLEHRQWPLPNDTVIVETIVGLVDEMITALVSTSSSSSSHKRKHFEAETAEDDEQLEEQPQEHQHKKLCAPTNETNIDWKPPLPPFTWTNEQQLIVNDFPRLGEDRVYESTAGSGKSSVLIERIVSVLSAPFHAAPENCLVMAFNTEAAASLRSRLKKRLQQLDWKPDQIDQVFQCKTMGCTIHSFARWAVREYKVVPAKQLHQYAVDEIPVLLRDVMRDNAELRNRITHSIQWVFVDEYQDVDAIQHEIVEMLRRPDTMRTVIGDPNQNLYSWRGTNPRFLTSFGTQSGNDHNRPDNHKRSIKSFTMCINQRSSVPIVRLCQAIIAKNYPPDREPMACVSYQELPTFQGTKDTLKPKIVIHSNSFGGIHWMVQDIQRIVFSRRLKPEDIAILCRNNHLLNYAEGLLRQRGLKTYFPSSDGESYGKSGQNGLDRTRGRIYLGTIFQAKGLEWIKVYGIGYHGEFFPDRRAPNIVYERNLHFVLCSRAKRELTLCMASDNPSLLIVEQPAELYDVTIAVTGSAASLNLNQITQKCTWPEDWIKGAQTVLLERSVTGKMTPEWHLGVTTLLRSLNGESYRRIKLQQIIPQSLLDQLERLDDSVDFARSDGYDDNNNNNSQQPHHQLNPSTFASIRQWTNKDAAMPYLSWIQDEFLEAEFGHFTDCLARRMLWQFSRKRWPSHPDLQIWTDKACDSCLTGDERKSLPDTKREILTESYRLCRRPELSWQQLLVHLWHVSWASSFRKNRTSVAYVPVRLDQLQQYQRLYDKMAVNLAYLVSQQPGPCLTAHTIRLRLDEETADPMRVLVRQKMDQYGLGNRLDVKGMERPNIVGEADCITPNGMIIDFKNFSVDADYLPIPYLLQCLLYASMIQLHEHQQHLIQQEQQQLKMNSVIVSLDPTSVIQNTKHSAQLKLELKSIAPALPIQSTAHISRISSVAVYNILGDRWYRVSLRDWTVQNSVALIQFMLCHFYDNWISNLSDAANQSKQTQPENHKQPSTI